MEDIPYVAFCTFGLLAFTAEWLFPARPVQYRSVFITDAAALGAYSLFFTLAVPVTDRIPIPDYAPASLAGMPVIYKIVLLNFIKRRRASENRSR
jgi:hypothetical protein